MQRQSAFWLVLVVMFVVGCYEREGDFQITMPEVPASEGDSELVAELFRLEMRAYSDGSLRTVQLDGKPLRADMTTSAERQLAFDALRRELVQRLADRDEGDKAELVIVADEYLDYKYVSTAMQQATLDDEMGFLVDTIRFELSP